MLDHALKRFPREVKAVEFGIALLQGSDDAQTLGAHPPLLVPWGDIAVDLRQLTWFIAAEFRFRRVPGIYLRISPGLAARLATAAGPWWPGQRFTDGRA